MKYIGAAEQTSTSLSSGLLLRIHSAPDLWGQIRNPITPERSVAPGAIGGRVRAGCGPRREGAAGRQWLAGADDARGSGSVGKTGAPRLMRGSARDYVFSGRLGTIVARSLAWGFITARRRKNPFVRGVYGPMIELRAAAGRLLPRGPLTTCAGRPASWLSSGGV